MGFAGPDHLVGTDHIDPVDCDEIVGAQKVQFRMVGKARGACIVDEDIDASPLRQCFGCHAATVGILCHVGLHKQGLAAGIANGRDCFLGFRD